VHMKEDDKNKIAVIQSEALNKIQELEERQSILSFVKKQADDKAQIEQDEKKQARERELFELMGGGTTSIYHQNKIITELPVNHDPKFVGFFTSLARIAQWTEEELRSYQKPAIAAKIINETIYSRFGKDIVDYIQEKNPYVSYCIRRHKHYKFLVEKGIILLEQFVSQAIQVMDESNSVHEYRVKMFTQYNVPYQMNIFERNSQ